jgi:hypothetical protein
VDILIMQLSSGRIRAFNIHKRLQLDGVAARLREAEILALDGRHGLDWKYLESKGTLPEAPAWYNSHDNMGCFNSTETSPHTPATVLLLKKVVVIFDEGLAQAWQLHRVAPVARYNAEVRRARELTKQRKRTSTSVRA